MVDVGRMGQMTGRVRLKKDSGYRIAWLKMTDGWAARLVISSLGKKRMPEMGPH
jgi:hypothetical protein